MPTDSQKSDMSFKKSIFQVGETDVIRKYFEEPLESRVFIEGTQIFSGTIPAVSPQPPSNFTVLDADQVVGDLTKRYRIVLAPLPGLNDAFYDPNPLGLGGKAVGVSRIKNAIPFNRDLTSISYLYKLEKSDNTVIYFGQGDWIFDVNSGILKFYDTLPSGVSAVQPPKISLYQYTGAFGASPTFTGALLDISGLPYPPTDNTFIVGNGTNYVSEGGPTVRTSLGLGTTDTPVFTSVELGGTAGANIIISANTVHNQNTTNPLTLTTSNNQNIVLSPNGTGVVQTDQLTLAGSTVTATSGNLELVSTLGGVNVTPAAGQNVSVNVSGAGVLAVENVHIHDNQIDSVDVASDFIITTVNNNDINLNPNGTGNVNVGTALNVDNLRIDGSTLSNTLANDALLVITTGNGDINLTPAGTGIVQTDQLNFYSSTISSDSGSNLSLITTTGSNNNISIIPDGTGDLFLGSAAVGGEVLLAQHPVSAFGAVTKQYVDNFAQGIEIKNNVTAKTVTSLPTYVKTGSGATAILSAVAVGAFPTIDGQAITAVGSRVGAPVSARVLVDQDGSVNDSDNGIYVLTQQGNGLLPWILSRASDFDGTTGGGEVVSGSFVLAVSGNTFANCGFAVISQDPITVDTDDILFAKFSGTPVVPVLVGVPTDTEFGNSADTNANTFNEPNVLSSDTIADAFDKVITIIDRLTPLQPAALSTFTSLTLNTAFYTAKAAIDNLSGGTPQGGTVITNVTNLSSQQPSVSSFGPFGKADTGTLNLFIKNTNGSATNQGTITLTTSNNTGNNGALALTETTGVFHNTLSAILNAAPATPVSFPPGSVTERQYSIQLQHTVSGNTNIVQFYQDNAYALTPSITAQSISSYTNLEHVSGVPVLTAGGASPTNSTVTVSFTANNCIGKFYNSSWVARTGTGSTYVDVQDYSPIGVDRTEGTNPAASTINNIQAGIFTSNLSIAVDARGSSGILATTQSAVHTLPNLRVDSISFNIMSTTFINEIQTGNITRRNSGTGQFPDVGQTTVGEEYSNLAAGDFDRSASLIQASGRARYELQLANGIYAYPSAVNYTGNALGGPNYSTIATNNDPYNNMRWATFRKINAISNSTFIIIEFGNAVNFGTDVIVPGLEVYVAVYTNGTDTQVTGWLDANTPYPGVGAPSTDGADALDYASSTATSKRVTFGYIPRTGDVVIRIGLPSGSTKSFTGLNIHT